ncbi:MAG TPA: dihydrolipoyllysine-residue acetyltransferase [Steroidobacteraceae bacterium]|nr:dihydrolipoyllysine-residue acetyltransferase [Steroidobacteraceae bacterium]
MSKITVPDIGDFKDVEVIDVLVKAGDKIDVDTPLLTIETEKATMDVPSTSAGVVKSVAIKKGDRVSKGSLIVEIDAGGQSEKSAAPAPAPPTETPKAAPAKPEIREEAKTQPATAPQGAPRQAQVTVPDIGDFKDVEVIEVLVKTGDMISVDTPLITLETEKATMDVPATEAGKVKSIAVKKGDRISKGRVILELEASGAAPEPKASAPASSVAASTTSSQPSAASATTGDSQIATSAAPRTQDAAATKAAAPAAIDEAGFSRAHASPSVRKFAREVGVDLSRVNGTGVKGRITPEDVKGWIKQALTSGGAAAGSGTGTGLPRVPEIDFSKFGTVEVKPLGRIQKISGSRLQASWLNIPHVWQMDEADITELEETRGKLKDKAAKEGIKLTPLAFVLRACVKALQEFPNVNSSLDPAAQNLVLKKYIHLGFAADTPNGLVVPVIRDADRKDIYELARDLAALSAKARDGKLSAAEMQGASFTVSSLGGIGGTSFTPIINAPEVAILGVAKSSMKPVYRDGQFVPRLILPFTFAYDHRVIDGAAGVRFTTFLAEKLADVRGLIEAVP